MRFIPTALMSATMRGPIAAVFLGAAVAITAPVPGFARSAPDSFADLAAQISDSVVNITTSTVVASATNEGGPVVPEGSPFEDFFRDFMDRNGEGPRRQRRGSALGSGFVISEDGFIVTNNHVIEGADEILIEFFDGDELAAEVIGTDPNTDIALLKVESDEALPFVPFGDSDDIRVGDWVMAMGNPLGQGFSVSAGIVSARGRALSGSYDDYIQTDAAINRGNSGGPLFNMDGEVVGVNTAILSPNGGSIGIGFAMSSAVVTGVIDQLQQFGETRRGWLGVRIQDVNDELADALGLGETMGALITDVPEGPAEAAGLKSGDVILQFDGGEISDTRELVRRVGNTAVGKAVDVVIFRDGDRETVSVTLGRRETAEAVPAAVRPETPTELSVLGMTLSNVTDDMRAEMELGSVDGILVMAVEEGSEASEKGLQPGDLITEIGQQAVTDVSDVEDRLEAAREAGRKSLLLLVRRNDQPRFVALSIE